VGENESDEPLVSTWLWRSTIIVLVIVVAVGLGLAAALAFGWRSPTPRRAPDWTAADLTWRRYGDGVATVAKDGYQLRLSQPDQHAWTVTSQRVTNFDLELDARAVTSNSDVGYGILYAYQDPENYSLFTIGNDGYYSIAVIREGERTSLRAWQQWPHVRRGDATNRLRVRCNETHCRFYINGEFTAAIMDSAFLNGSVGLWAQNYSNDLLAVVFDHIQLWSLE
jgi:hypothetical protein